MECLLFVKRRSNETGERLSCWWCSGVGEEEGDEMAGARRCDMERSSGKSLSELVLSRAR